MQHECAYKIKEISLKSTPGWQNTVLNLSTEQQGEIDSMNWTSKFISSPPNLTDCSLLAIERRGSGRGEGPSLVQQRDPLKHLRRWDLIACDIAGFHCVKSRECVTLPTAVSSLFDRYVDPNGSENRDEITSCHLITLYHLDTEDSQNRCHLCHQRSQIDWNLEESYQTKPPKVE